MAGRFASATGGMLFLAPLLMILFRQKYPRWWFDWNLELLRFANRVGAYLAAPGRPYPSTDDGAGGHLDFAYPDATAGLNRWLPLVKWFLAIPHFVVLVFLGSGRSRSSSPGSRSSSPAGTRAACSTSSWASCAGTITWSAMRWSWSPTSTRRSDSTRDADGPKRTNRRSLDHLRSMTAPPCDGRPTFEADRRVTCPDCGGVHCLRASPRALTNASQKEAEGLAPHRTPFALRLLASRARRVGGLRARAGT